MSYCYNKWQQSRYACTSLSSTGLYGSCRHGKGKLVGSMRIWHLRKTANDDRGRCIWHYQHIPSFKSLNGSASPLLWFFLSYSFVQVFLNCVASIECFYGVIMQLQWNTLLPFCSFCGAMRPGVGVFPSVL